MWHWADKSVATSRYEDLLSGDLWSVVKMTASILFKTRDRRGGLLAGTFHFPLLRLHGMFVDCLNAWLAKVSTVTAYLKSEQLLLFAFARNADFDERLQKCHRCHEGATCIRRPSRVSPVSLSETVTLTDNSVYRQWLSIGAVSKT